MSESELRFREIYKLDKCIPNRTKKLIQIANDLMDVYKQKLETSILHGIDYSHKLPYYDSQFKYDPFSLERPELELIRVVQFYNVGINILSDGFWELIHNQFHNIFFQDSTARTEVMSYISCVGLSTYVDRMCSE